MTGGIKMKYDTALLILTLAVGALLLVVVGPNLEPDTQAEWAQYALSFGFTPEGARAYGFARQLASERGDPLPTPDGWARDNPLDIDMGSHDGVGICQCAARGAMQDNPAYAGYLKEGMW